MCLIKSLTLALSSAMAVANIASAQPQGQAQYDNGAGFHGAAHASPAVAARFNNAAYRTIQGQVMAVATYALNGECGATIGGRTGGRRISTQSCRYSVQEIGSGRVQMTSLVTLNGKTMQDTTVLQLRPDGSLYDEKYRAVMVRIQ